MKVWRSTVKLLSFKNIILRVLEICLKYGMLIGSEEINTQRCVSVEPAVISEWLWACILHFELI